MAPSADRWDVIVVGAGTAGCVLAERLTRSGKLRVLLVEAGSAPRSRFVAIPAGFAQLFRGPHDWAFESEPQSLAGGRRVFIPRGKMLGGSANMNAQIHQWCHPADFADWVADGATGWGWEDVAPVFQAQETWLGDADPRRGRSGPMRISPNGNTRPLARAFVAACRAAGLGSQATYNGTAYRGAWLCELAHFGGERFSVYNAYLEPALRRPNLDVWTESRALRLVGVPGRIAGVEVRGPGGTTTVAGRGIVLAGGAFGTPQILQLSGIGPAAHLQSLGLPVLGDVAEVGQNLQDHPMTVVVFRVRSRNTLKRATAWPSLLNYALRKRGMLASNGVEAFAFTTVERDESAPPDLELLAAPFEWRNQGLELPGIHAFTLGVAALTPRSRGSVRVQSADSQAPPLIDFGLLSDAEGRDAATLLAGVRLARRLAATPPLDQDVAEESYPGAQAVSDAELLPWIHASLQTVYHPTSTCRMGSDKRAPVDPRLRFQGFDNLWVADASVMPRVPRGHPNAVVAMIAERAAGWIEQAL